MLRSVVCDSVLIFFTEVPVVHSMLLTVPSLAIDISHRNISYPPYLVTGVLKLLIQLFNDL